MSIDTVTTPSIDISVHVDKFKNGTPCRRLDFHAKLSDGSAFHMRDDIALIESTQGADYLRGIVEAALSADEVDHVRVKDTWIEIKGYGGKAAQTLIKDWLTNNGYKVVVTTPGQSCQL